MAGGNEEFPPALRDWIIDNIRIGNQIGRGANGRILEAKWEGIVVAVKEIHSIFMNEVSELEFWSFKRSFLRECEQSSRLRHPNIVRFFGIYYPPGARVPSLVMERLHCSLTSLLENNPVIPIGTKTSIIKDVALGLRYLHTRNTPIIHRDLSSNNVLLSKGMEGKIGDLGTARLVDPRRQSRMTKAPGTVDFMPPEALEDVVANVHYGKELDVFSFGCVMLHTLSHQWPTPSQAVIINPETGLATGGRTEVERRTQYYERIDRSKSDVLIPLIENCLSNLPKNRPSIVGVCDQLEGQLVDREYTLNNELIMPALQQEIQEKDAELQRKYIEIQRKDIEIQRNYNEIQRKDHELQQKDAELHRKDIEIQRNYREVQRKVGEIQQKDAELQRKNIEIQRKDIEIQRKNVEILTLHDKDMILETLPKEVNKSTKDFWISQKLTWQQCADLPSKCWATSVAELDEKVYLTIIDSKFAHLEPLKYDYNKDQWSSLPELPYTRFSLVTVPDRKQLLAIGGVVDDDGKFDFSNKVFLWDEVHRKWTTPYPNMPTARYYCSSISHESIVIVAGGVTSWDPCTMTRAVEVLHIKERNLFTKSHWSVVEQLPFLVCNAIPLIVNDKLYITVGSGENKGASTCNVVTASLPELLQSRNKNTSSGQVWNKLPDMPFASFSIVCYQGHLITFSGGHKVEKRNTDKPVYKPVPLIHIYNHYTNTWDCVGEIPYEYLLGRSVHIVSENKILFIGGVTGTCDINKDDNIISSCSILTLLPW